LESENAITTARNAYNILLSNQKGYVTNYSKLTNAEDKLAELKKDTDEKTVNMVCSIIDKDGKISSKTYLNIADPALVDGLNKASGLQAPTGIPQTPEMMAPPTEHSANDGHGH